MCKVSSGVLIFFTCLFANVWCGELFCEFIKHSDGYNCEIKNSTEFAEIIVGSHLTNKTNDDVTVLFAPFRNKISTIPKNACRHFKNIQKFEIVGKFIKDLSPEIFNDCTKVRSVYILMTDLITLNENLFDQLSSLQSVIISENKFLQKLPKELFKNNQQLWSVDLSYNNLSVIKVEFPQSTTTIQLYNNPCIDAVFSERESAKKALKEKCSDQGEKDNLKDLEKFENLHLEIFKLDTRVDDFETMLQEALTLVKSKIGILEKLYINSAEYGKKINDEALSKMKRINELHDQTQKLENTLKSFMNKDEISFDHLRAENDGIQEQVNRNYLLISILFMIVIVLFLTCVALVLTIKYKRKFYRSEIYLMKGDDE